MKSQLEKLLDTLNQKIERAEELADSENETTAARYEEVVDALNAACYAIEEAIASLEDK